MASALPQGRQKRRWTVHSGVFPPAVGVGFRSLDFRERGSALWPMGSVRYCASGEAGGR
jgi:hypothetical protein